MRDTHSERRHRRDLARSDAKIRRSFEVEKKASYDDRRAATARRKAADQDDPRTLRGKIRKLETDHRRVGRQPASSYRDRWLAFYSMRIEHFRERLAELGASEQDPVGKGSLKPGDTVRCYSEDRTVIRVSAKSVTVEPGMYPGDTMRVPFSALEPEQITVQDPATAERLVAASKRRVAAVKEPRCA